jgi:signal transduction histidine kinase/ActR/RegA family two-component response regulator
MSERAIPSIHRRVVTMALTVSAAAVIVALIGITLFDAQRYRANAREDAASLAGIIAENSAAAIAFDDTAAAEAMLATAELQTDVTRACIYSAEGAGLFASYTRDAGAACPDAPPAAPPDGHQSASRVVAGANDTLGVVYLEADVSGVWPLVWVLAAVGLLMLLIAGAVSFVLAQKLSRQITRPLSELAAHARRIGHEGDFSMAHVRAEQDEVGDLVRAFQGMLGRVREANEGLLHEIERRKVIELERELLLERERESSRMKDEFVANVSHELRTPLGAILGWIQVMKVTRLDAAMLEKAVDAITRSAEAQAQVIEDLVDVTRIGAGKLQLSIGVIDVRAPVTAAVEVARPTAVERELRLETDMPADPIFVKGDASRLQQVVANLLSNAVKFTDAGGCIRIAVRATRDVCDVVVTDDGVGIDPAFLPHIFDRYRQADSSTNRHYQGLGLGLSIVKEVTELHGGTVVAESAGLGKGTTFRVRLPRHASVELPRATAAPAAGGERLDGVEVLVVDDNLDALDILVTALEAVGAEVRTASSGAAAIEAWSDHAPDVLLCDLAMPGMDGFDVLASVRRLDASTERQTPAIAVTAHATADHRRRTAEAGFTAHINKPYRIAELIRTVRSALDTTENSWSRT